MSVASSSLSSDTPWNRDRDLQDLTAWARYLHTSPLIYRLQLQHQTPTHYQLVVTDLHKPGWWSFQQRAPSSPQYLRSLWQAYQIRLPPLTPNPELPVSDQGLELWQRQRRRVFYSSGYQYYCIYGRQTLPGGYGPAEGLTIQQTSRPTSRECQHWIRNPRLLSRGRNVIDGIPEAIRTQILAEMMGHLTTRELDLRGQGYISGGPRS